MNYFSEMFIVVCLAEQNYFLDKIILLLIEGSIEYLNPLSNLPPGKLIPFTTLVSVIVTFLIQL